MVLQRCENLNVNVQMQLMEFHEALARVAKKKVKPKSSSKGFHEVLETFMSDMLQPRIKIGRHSLA